MKSIGLAPFVFGEYTKFIPYYIYSILKSYPHYYVKVFTQELLTEKENECLRLLKNEFPDHFEIRENYFNEIEFSKIDIANKKQVQKSLRWLIPYEELKEFENVYIGDIDFLIVKEDPPLLQGHLHHCETTGLPYSNAVRPSTRRLSGLHFFKVKEYYEKMNPIINYYLNNMNEVSSIISKGGGNEEFLYTIIELGIGFEGLEKLRYRRHHGFHLGCISNGKIKPGYLGYTNVPQDANKRTSFDLMKPKLHQYFQDPLFLDMIELIADDKLISLAKIVVEKTNNTRLLNLMASK